MQLEQTSRQTFRTAPVIKKLRWLCCPGPVPKRTQRHPRTGMHTDALNVRHSCGKLLWGTHVGHSCRASSCRAFSCWTLLRGPRGKFFFVKRSCGALLLRHSLVGGTVLWSTLVGHSWGTVDTHALAGQCWDIAGSTLRINSLTNAGARSLQPCAGTLPAGVVSQRAAQSGK